MEPECKRHASGQVSIPLTNSSRKNKSPFEVLPEELWRTIILEYMDNVSNIQNICTAFPEFSTVFRKQITTLRFIRNSPQVFEYQPSLEYPHVPPNLINMEWCQVLYQFLHVRQIPPLVQRFLSVTELASSKTLSTVQEVLNFHQSLQANPNIPSYLFPALDLTMALDTVDCREYLSACVDMVSEFGPKVQKVSLVLNYTNVKLNENQFFVRFVEFLANLPNVRSLKIGLKGLTTNHESQLIEELRECTLYPTVTLPHLQELQILSSLPIKQTLVQYFLNGRHFEKGGLKTLLLDHLDSISDKWNQGRNVSLVLKYQQTLQMSQPTFGKMLENQEPKIGLLTSPHSLGMLHLLQWLSGEGYEVEELIIDKPSKRLKRLDQSLAMTKLPMVKYLNVADNSETVFEFLAALPNLEYLHVEGMPETKTWLMSGGMKYEDYSALPITKLVRYYLYVERFPKEYNIWKTFPSLKMLVLEHECNVTKYFVREHGDTPVVFQNTILVDVE